MTLSENIREFWLDLSGLGKLGMITAALIVVGTLIGLTYSSISTKFEVRKFEQEASRAKADAKTALETAAKIGKEKLEAEQQLAEVEAKRDGKVTEYEKAKINTLDARAEYLRSVRESRTDDPSAEQLCAELAALGYPCR